MICEFGAGEVVSENLLEVGSVSTHYGSTDLAQANSVAPAGSVEGEGSGIAGLVGFAGFDYEC